MKEYTIWYSETQTFKGYFKANNKEEAIAKLTQLRDGEIDFDDIRDWFEKGKDTFLELDPNDVVESQ